MDLWTILAAIVSSTSLSAGVSWFAKAMIEHRLTEALENRKGALAKELETHKNVLSEQLEQKKAMLQNELARGQTLVEGAVKREVELYLGDRAAERQYEFEARKRLYLAVGPLRFQLLLACRDLAGRIEGHGTRENYRLDMEGYYGRSTLYRLLRPLAIVDLIERQIAYSDFAVDSGALDYLRFKKSMTRILSGDEIVLNHPHIDWSRQVEHVYADSLGVAANALIQATGSSERVLRFDEFNDAISQDGPNRFNPLHDMLTNFEITAKPILWLRLVAYGNACNAFITRAGSALGFEQRAFPVAELLEAGKDAYILGQKTEYLSAVSALTLLTL